MVYVACIYAASRIQLWNALPNWMQAFARKVMWLYCRFQRWWNNTAFNTFTWALGWGIVFLLSTQYDWSTQHTRYGVSVAWALPSFVIQRKILWGDRSTGLWSSGRRWWSYWFLSQIGNIGVSYLVVSMSGLPFLLVCAMLMPYSTLLPYLVRDKWIFKQKTANA